MPRYFLEVAYKGTHYSGFQIQKNAPTIQDEIEKSWKVFFKRDVSLTGSSRTDAGVHALQNYFHFDWEEDLDDRFLYNLNAILPGDIVIKNIHLVAPKAHCRFDAISREYSYYIYTRKDPFLVDTAYFFPYKLDIDSLNKAAALIKENTDFTSFSKRNTQVKTFQCTIILSEWVIENDMLVYHIKGNRFLRGMVRALTATMLKVGRQNITLDELHNIIMAKDCTLASFSAPPHGLFLKGVEYPNGMIN